ncbi:MAG: sugar transporter [Burkholderiales bacterium]|nr:sugar transporter [Burkholderiales bacterium]MDR4518182.1 lipoprotein [Nitrosomonas sp.]
MHLMVRYFFLTACTGMALGILVACGNKGPLYLPDNEEPPVSMAPTTPPAAATIKDETE